MNSFIAFVCFFIAIAAAMAYPHPDEHHFIPHYHFEYGVDSPHTHDHKKQKEERHHDDVHGSYSLHEPDGTKRIVDYSSAKHVGFQALVKREGHAKHPHGATSYVGPTHWGHGSGR